MLPNPAAPDDRVPIMVPPFLPENSEATLRAITQGSSFQAPRAQPNESITRRFTSWTTSGDKIFVIQGTGEFGELMGERFGHKSEPAIWR